MGICYVWMMRDSVGVLVSLHLRFGLALNCVVGFFRWLV